MKSTDWINLEEAAGRLSGTTEEITCLIRDGILGALIDREGEVFVQSGEIDRWVEILAPASAALRAAKSKCHVRARNERAASHRPA
jgi:hypothetical protein